MLCIQLLLPVQPKKVLLMRNRLPGITVLAACFFLFACKHPGTTSHKGGAITFNNFLDHFPLIHLPFNYDADSLQKVYPDSLRLDPAHMKRYLPDSLWDGGSHGKARVFPIGQARKASLHLLLVRVSTLKTDKADLLVYGKGDSVLSVRQVASVRPDHPGHVFSCSIDDNGLLHLSERKQEAGGHVIRRERVYGINADGSYTLILVNTNEPPAPGTFYNPIDTFPAHNRFSGDYAAAKSDIVCIRDGDKKGTFRFFIHLDKDRGGCTGELNGVGKFTGAGKGQFQELDGPCAVRFTFTSRTVTISETGGCGAYRGVTCNFAGTYRRQKGSR